MKKTIRENVMEQIQSESPFDSRLRSPEPSEAYKASCIIINGLLDAAEKLETVISQTTSIKLEAEAGKLADDFVSKARLRWFNLTWDRYSSTKTIKKFTQVIVDMVKDEEQQSQFKTYRWSVGSMLNELQRGEIKDVNQADAQKHVFDFQLKGWVKQALEQDSEVSFSITEVKKGN